MNMLLALCLAALVGDLTFQNAVKCIYPLFYSGSPKPNVLPKPPNAIIASIMMKMNVCSLPQLHANNMKSKSSSKKPLLLQQSMIGATVVIGAVHPHPNPFPIMSPPSESACSLFQYYNMYMLFFGYIYSVNKNNIYHDDQDTIKVIKARIG